MNGLEVTRGLCLTKGLQTLGKQVNVPKNDTLLEPLGSCTTE